MPSILGSIGSALSTANNALSTANRLYSTVSSIANGGLSSLLSGMIGGWSAEKEDFNTLRIMSRRLMRTEFQAEWLFRLDVAGAPSDLDLYVKDISYSVFDMTNDDEQIGAAVMSWPRGVQSLKVAMTVRDNVDRRVTTFLKTWAAQVVHPDGTVGLPYGASGYVRNVNVYMQSPGGTETLDCSLEMYPLQCGDITMSRDNCQHKEIPVTFVQFTNLETTLSTSLTSSRSSSSSSTNSQSLSR